MKSGIPPLTGGRPRAARGHPRATRGRRRMTRGCPRMTRGCPRMTRGCPRMFRGHLRMRRGGPRAMGGCPRKARQVPRTGRGGCRDAGARLYPQDQPQRIGMRWQAPVSQAFRICCGWCSAYSRAPITPYTVSRPRCSGRRAWDARCSRPHRFPNASSARIFGRQPWR